MVSYLSVHQQPNGQGHIQSSFRLDLNWLHVRVGCRGRGVVNVNVRIE